MKIELEHPVTVGGNTITSLTLRRPKGRDMRTIARHSKALSDQGDGADRMAATLDLIASMSDSSIEVIDELDADDVNKLAEAMSAFFPAAPSFPPRSGGA